MDKNAIKKYAIWARRELIARASQRAALYEITADGYGNVDTVSVHGRILSLEERNQRKALIVQIQQKGFEQVMEEIAYTWFNRFSALRFMEVNGYLPSHVRVFTDEENNFNPQIMTEAINLEMDGLDMQKVFAFKTANDDDGLFRYLIITQCNALSDILPGMFQKISDYTELLFPDNLLREGSVVEQMVSMIPEEDWTDQVQIIGWLYQYYNTELKDLVFANLKKNIKITKENIPAATQLFTPDWIVHYMVENSLGRLWLEGHPNDALKSEWKYYLDEAEQEPEVQAQLDTIRKEYAALKPEEIRVIDPCMGSGHILCVLFDVLVRIYEDYGYTEREAAVKIVENNLWGLDIDERAAQLSYFAVMMKARQYDRRFFTRKVQPHVYAIEESNGITSAPMHDMGLNLTQEEHGKAVKQAMRLVEEMHDAKEYGSLIRVTPCDWDLLRRFAVPREEGWQLHLDVRWEIEARLKVLINVGEILAQKYAVVATNPPYMSRSGMGSLLARYIKQHFPDSKADLFSVFIEKCLSFIKENGFQAMITQHSWMFLSSFEALRKKLEKEDIVNMAHLGARAFEEIGGEVVQTTSFVIRRTNIPRYKGTYQRLIDENTQNGKMEVFLKKDNLFISSKSNFELIPGRPFAYWVTERQLETFGMKSIADCGFFSYGVFTCNNALFLRLWHEVSSEKIDFSNTNGEANWKLLNKGGTGRKWYGNQEYIINYGESGQNIRRYRKENGQSESLPGEDLYFREHISWSLVTSSGLTFRYYPKGMIFDISAPSMFNSSHNELLKVLGVLNSRIGQFYLPLFNPTMNNTNSDIKRIPFICESDDVVHLVEENINLSKQDWDSFETSWDFTYHPFIQSKNLMSEAYNEWQRKCKSRYSTVMSNETKINEILISEYHLEEELSPYVFDEEITLYRADLQREVRSFISYAIGCMFGRYSLDIPGLIYAGGELDMSKYKTFEVDGDAIIPICDDEYFNDDIVGRFVKFVEVVYGKETLEENLKFIADALGGIGTSREIIRNYFINGFYADHLKVYQKRPIYWLFDSGKKNGFKCLVYMHRYQPDTIARIRTDYVHEQQSRYRTAMADLQNRIDSAATTSERMKLTKKLKTVREQDEELRIYEEKIHHLADKMIEIDLDDGVKVNYAKFQDVLAKIK